MWTHRSANSLRASCSGFVLRGVIAPKRCVSVRPNIYARYFIQISASRFNPLPIGLARFYSSFNFPRSESIDGSGARMPLEGITIVSLEQAVAAPLATRHCADLGARVIKVERPGGGDFARDYDQRVNGLCSHFAWCNRSKESLALDLKSDDLAVLKKLLLRADVLVQNLAPGASERLGLSYESLSEENSSLIVCDISGYGSDGPYRDKKAYDLLIQSEAGVISVTGTPDEPVKVGVSIADIAAGMYAYSSILAALMLRQKTGKGCRLDISMFESMVEWMGFPLYYTYDNSPPPVRAGASHATIYPYGPFKTGDGRSIMLGIQNQREWINFCDNVLSDASLKNDPRFAKNSDRTKNRESLREIICASFAQKSAEQVASLLDEAGIANATVNELSRVWNHPQLIARNRWTTVDSSVGQITALVPPGHAAGHKGSQLKGIPSVGQHNDQILAELSETG